MATKRKAGTQATTSKAKQAKRERSVDQFCTLGSALVYEDWDCMLNQTNIANNNNKYYVIQLLKSGTTYHVWNRWGRVGEVSLVLFTAASDELL